MKSTCEVNFNSRFHSKMENAFQRWLCRNRLQGFQIDFTMPYINAPQQQKIHVTEVVHRRPTQRCVTPEGTESKGSGEKNRDHNFGSEPEVNNKQLWGKFRRTLERGIILVNSVDGSKYFCVKFQWKTLSCVNAKPSVPTISCYSTKLSKAQRELLSPRCDSLGHKSEKLQWTHMLDFSFTFSARSQTLC